MSIFGSEIEALLKDSIRMMWLAQGYNRVIVQLTVSVYNQK